MNLSDIKRIIADHKPAPDPFNGATNLVLAPGLMAAMRRALEVWARNPLMGKCPEIEARSALPEGHGYGFRAWRDGDDPELRGIPVIVWVLAPKKLDD